MMYTYTQTLDIILESRSTKTVIWNISLNLKSI